MLFQKREKTLEENWIFNFIDINSDIWKKNEDYKDYFFKENYFSHDVSGSRWNAEPKYIQIFKKLFTRWLQLV